MRATSIFEVLADAQRRGYVGPGDLADFVGHALGYLDGFERADRPPDGDQPVYVDLGSGGGIPGLVLAIELAGSRWHLVERARGRADWLTRSVARLELQDRVHVRHEPAEVTGRGGLRRECAVVVARSFGPPAAAAECAAPLLRVGGHAFFSDLDGSARWDEAGLGELGLVLVRQWTGGHGHYAALEQRKVCPDRFPRAAGVPARRPLF